MFGINFNRLVAAAAVMAFCCGTSFAAGPKMGQHKVAKISAKKSHMMHSSKKAKIEPIEQNLSEEELFAIALESKNISKDGNTLTDKRDGKTYKVEIKGDKAWMKNNLAFSLSTPKQCLLEDEGNCKKFGRFYSHKEASKACPAGWHLPNDGEWRDYQKDQSKLDWNNLGKGGCKDWDGYCEGDNTGHYWSASKVKKNTARSWEFRSVAHSINRTDESLSKGLYVRCVADLR
jgi:hypothetical protein